MSEILTEPVTGPSAWTPAELAADDGWIYPLGAAEIAELEAAVKEVGEKGLELYEFGAIDFPLPTLSATMGDIAEQLENGPNPFFRTKKHEFLFQIFDFRNVCKQEESTNVTSN